jgi:hypothetical protein
MCDAVSGQPFNLADIGEGSTPSTTPDAIPSEERE